MSIREEFLTQVDRLYQQFQAHDAQQSDRLQRYRNIEPESAQCLALLIRAQQAKRILEIGTSTGYSTLWLANAAQSTLGQVTTLEIDAERTAQAQSYAHQLQLQHLVDFRTVDALDFLQQAAHSYDFILLDSERDAYVEYWPYLQKILTQKGGMLVVDNVLSHASDVEQFISLVQANPKYSSVTLPIGAGLLLITAN
ncbi:O-methyltransferase [Acinetobacter sp. ANC 3813]|uniref:O-methyltransferase n=1 Tax=Acinetobacter sp. ANC 3813 TaxID=1977873 RepID=UPI000A333F22|nr:class I SAM-dependent methyltransferase [Acinetobacter sp. ANC 3813]OTG90809.1 methyltransferase [Acinetobacter sp. ANC 3813]